MAACWDALRPTVAPRRPTESLRSNTNTVETSSLRRGIDAPSSANTTSATDATRSTDAVRHCQRGTPRRRRDSSHSKTPIATAISATTHRHDRSDCGGSSPGRSGRGSVGATGSGSTRLSSAPSDTATVRSAPSVGCTVQKPGRSAVSAPAPAGRTRSVPFGAVMIASRPAGGTIGRRSLPALRRPVQSQ